MWNFYELHACPLLSPSIFPTIIFPCIFSPGISLSGFSPLCLPPAVSTLGLSPLGLLPPNLYAPGVICIKLIPSSLGSQSLKQAAFEDVYLSPEVSEASGGRILNAHRIVNNKQVLKSKKKLSQGRGS